MNNRSRPPGTVIPQLPYADVGEAANWLCEVFGFSERLRIANHRSQLRVGSASVVAMEARPTLGLAAILVQVSDVNAHYQRAVQHGAQIVSPPTTYPFGERQYTVQDLAGHSWTFTESVADVDPEDWGGVLISVGEGAA